MTLVMLSPSTPLSEPAASVAAGGTTGAVVSITMERIAEVGEVLPATSVDVVAMRCVPCVNTEDVKLHVPPAVTMVEPSRTPPS